MIELQSDRRVVSFPEIGRDTVLANRESSYPFAVKVATGKIKAVTGETWREGLSRNPQDHLVVPTQPWLDGYCVEKGIIRQFVAMPPGEGYTASGCPWFDYYDGDAKALERAQRLAGIKSVATMAKEKRQTTLADNESLVTPHLMNLRAGLRKGQV
jgi:hypothetical protein